MTTPLTALERDLLACVERLVTAREVSAKELSRLEERSTTKTQSQMDGIAQCATLLVRSQAVSMKALRRNAARFGPIPACLKLNLQCSMGSNWPKRGSRTEEKVAQISSKTTQPQHLGSITAEFAQRFPHRTQPDPTASS